MLSRLPRPVLKLILVLLEKAFSLARKKIPPPFPYNATTNTITLPVQVENELRGLIAIGKKVDALKRVTTLTGAGLRVSKDYVDTLAERR